MDKYFYIFRHALAVKEGEHYGDKIISATILDEGIPALERLASFLKKVTPSANFSSELIRCRQTVQIISDMTGKQFIFDKRLNEYHAERFINLRERVISILEDIAGNENKNILICTHGAVIAALTNLLTKESFEESRVLDYPDSGELLVIKNKSIQKLSFR